MLLERTLLQLDIGPVSAETATQLGQLGYLQWLGALPGSAGYRMEAMRAYTLAIPMARKSPAIAVFCDLLVASTRSPLEPLPLTLAIRQRRGGTLARRAWR